MATDIFQGVSKYSKGGIVFAEKIWFFKKARFDPNTTISSKNVKQCAATSNILTKLRTIYFKAVSK